MSGRKLWLAGLGAIGEVVDLDKASQRRIDRWAERGRPVDERGRKTLEEVGQRAGSALREIGKLLQDTVEYESTTLLKKIGVMTREDVKLLSARIDSLSRQIDEYAAARSLRAEP